MKPNRWEHKKGKEGKILSLFGLLDKRRRRDELNATLKIDNQERLFSAKSTTELEKDKTKSAFLF